MWNKVYAAALSFAFQIQGHDFDWSELGSTLFDLFSNFSRFPFPSGLAVATCSHVLSHVARPRKNSWPPYSLNFLIGLTRVLS